MGNFTDRYGLALSTQSAAAAASYSEAVDLNLAGSVGVEETLAEAVEADAGFALAHAALARTHQFRGRFPEAREAITRARELVEGATRREQSHVAAVAVAVEGNSKRALELVKEHAAEFPRDAFVLSQANGPFGLIGFGGGPDWRQEQFALLAPLEAAYGDDWWFLSALSFAHNELYHFEEARRLAERSLALHPRSGHGSHTMAHVFFETGGYGEGGAFLDGWLPGYERAASLYGHLWWHRALFGLASRDYDSAMAIYEERLRPGINEGAPIIVMADCAALLWRCDVYGETDRALPWEEVSAFAARSFPHAGLTFADVHAAMAFARAGDGEQLERLAAEVRERAAAGKLPAGDVAPALVEALAMFARGEYGAAAGLLEPFVPQIVRVGGSNAQRQVFEDTLLEAYLRAGWMEKAEALLRDRLNRRPSSRDERWLERARSGAGA